MPKRARFTLFGRKYCVFGSDRAEAIEALKNERAKREDWSAIGDEWDAEDKEFRKKWRPAPYGGDRLGKNASVPAAGGEEEVIVEKGAASSADQYAIVEEGAALALIKSPLRRSRRHDVFTGHQRKSWAPGRCLRSRKSRASARVLTEMLTRWSFFTQM